MISSYGERRLETFLVPFLLLKPGQPYIIRGMLSFGTLRFGFQGGYLSMLLLHGLQRGIDYLLEIGWWVGECQCHRLVSCVMQ